jgi:hypothetical protein
MGQTVDEVIGIVGIALEQAKEAGGDRVVLATAPTVL